MNQLKSIDLIGKTGTQGFVARLLELACPWGIGVVPCGPAVGSLRTVAGLPRRRRSTFGGTETDRRRAAFAEPR